ncbi:MAG: hypothetical protein Q8P67_09525 [archaeon]|nr:hypothetical protein [archaeon]
MKEEGAAEAHQLFQRLDITASTGGRGSLIYGDAQGCINIIDRDFKAQTWQAYDHRVTHLKQLQRRNVIISIGNDEELDPTIKVWHLDRRDKQGNPQLLQELTLTRDKPVPVTCFAVTEQLSHIAVGLADGAVILIAGDILRTRSPKQRVIRKPSGGLDYITGLGFRERNQTITLFCVTNSCVLSYSINDDGSEVRLNELDSDKGAELHCVCLNSSN